MSLNDQAGFMFLESLTLLTNLNLRIYDRGIKMICLLCHFPFFVLLGWQSSPVPVNMRCCLTGFVLSVDAGWWFRTAGAHKHHPRHQYRAGPLERSKRAASQRCPQQVWLVMIASCQVPRKGSWLSEKHRGRALVFWVFVIMRCWRCPELEWLNYLIYVFTEVRPLFTANMASHEQHNCNW